MTSALATVRAGTLLGSRAGHRHGDNSHLGRLKAPCLCPVTHQGAKKEVAPEVKTPILGFSSTTAQDEQTRNDISLTSAAALGS